ncbi:transcriptional regulator of AraC family [alpha proteobacterium U9-1i]|nr:transcriptional regulator of AraC family [alpha proteobacterium U9-1i]
MGRHRHAEGYIAIVVSGGYLEAGDQGRYRAEPGHVLVHRPYESHQDHFSGRGATALNLPAIDLGDDAFGAVDDVDTLVRIAERDPRDATLMLREQWRPLDRSLDDWPDQLARALTHEADFCIGAWSRAMGLAPQSVSRGFQRAFGTSPKSYRLEQRVLRALSLLPSWGASLAQLAAHTGFADQAHLTRATAALTGQTPRAFRVKSVQAATA